MPAATMISQGGDKNMARQPWPVDRKIELVLEGLRGHRPVTELCREAGISTARYYQWRQQFLDAGRAGLASAEAQHNKLEERIRQLEAENASLQTRVRIFQDVCLAD
jgi:transposase-like protein